MNKDDVAEATLQESMKDELRTIILQVFEEREEKLKDELRAIILQVLEEREEKMKVVFETLKKHDEEKEKNKKRAADNSNSSGRKLKYLFIMIFLL